MRNEREERVTFALLEEKTNCSCKRLPGSQRLPSDPMVRPASAAAPASCPTRCSRRGAAGAGPAVGAGDVQGW